MHTDGYSFLSGHAVIGVTTIALERGLLHLEDTSEIRLDTRQGRCELTRLVMAGE